MRLSVEKLLTTGQIMSIFFFVFSRRWCSLWDIWVYFGIYTLTTLKNQILLTLSHLGGILNHRKCDALSVNYFKTNKCQMLRLCCTLECARWDLMDLNRHLTNTYRSIKILSRLFVCNRPSLMHFSWQDEKCRAIDNNWRNQKFILSDVKIESSLHSHIFPILSLLCCLFFHIIHLPVFLYCFFFVCLFPLF